MLLKKLNCIKPFQRLHGTTTTSSKNMQDANQEEHKLSGERLWFDRHGKI